MNKFLKLFLVAYVLCAIGMLGVTFVACSNGDDSGSPATGNPKNNGGNDNDGNNNNGNDGAAPTTGTATFTSSEFYGGTIKIEYKADGSYLMTWSIQGLYSTNKGKGTYTLTGTFENGTIHQHQTHSSDTLNSNWIEDVEDNDLVVTNGSFTVQLKDDDDVENVTFTKVNS